LTYDQRPFCPQSDRAAARGHVPLYVYVIETRRK